LNHAICSAENVCFASNASVLPSACFTVTLSGTPGAKLVRPEIETRSYSWIFS
jgi:hypothetical protein